MKINNKIPAVMVSNIFLRKALAEAVRKSNYKIDDNYIGIDVINNLHYVSFVLNDTQGKGAGFAKIDTSDALYTFISTEKMMDILSLPPFFPVEVKLNNEYTAVIQSDGSVTVGCQTFTKDAICKLLLEIEKVTAKNS